MSGSRGACRFCRLVGDAQRFFRADSSESFVIISDTRIGAPILVCSRHEGVVRDAKKAFSAIKQISSSIYGDLYYLSPEVVSGHFVIRVHPVEKACSKEEVSMGV